MLNHPYLWLILTQDLTEPALSLGLGVDLNPTANLALVVEAALTHQMTAITGVEGGDVVREGGDHTPSHTREVEVDPTPHLGHVLVPTPGHTVDRHHAAAVGIDLILEVVTAVTVPVRIARDLDHAHHDTLVLCSRNTITRGHIISVSEKNSRRKISSKTKISRTLIRIQTYRNNLRPVGQRQKRQSCV